LAVAYIKGQAEATAFNKALLLTGNYSGQTADSLASMAKSLSGFGTTQHAAAAALTEVAQSGKFTAAQIRLVGQAALDMSKLTGQSTQDTIKQFEKLQDSPLKAVTALDSAQHFLTTSIYEQIKALEDQGRAQDAADLAMHTYAKTVSDRTAEVQKNLGLIEQSWNGIKSAALEAADAALSIGRATTGQEQFDAISKKRNALLDVQSQGAQLTVSAQGKAIPIQQQIDDYTKQLAALQDAQITAQKDANKKSIAAQSTLALEQSDAEADLYNTKEQKRAKETLAAYNKANEGIVKAMAAGDTATAERIAQNYVKINEGIAEKYKDKVAKAHVGSKVNPLASLNSLTDKAITENSAGAIGNDPQAKLQFEQVTRLQAIAKAADEATKKGASLAEVQGLVAIATANVNEYFAKEADQLRQKNIDAVARYKASLDDMLETRKQQIAQQVASLSQSALESQHNQELLSLQKDYDKKRAELVKQQQNTTSALEKASYQQKIDDLESYNKDVVADTKKGWADRAAEQANGIDGMKRAI
jgi:phage-related minor tail protein